jgi:hypothetical protein
MQSFIRKTTIFTIYRNVSVRYLSVIPPIPPGIDFSSPQVQNMMKSMLHDPKVIKQIIGMNPKFEDLLKDPKAMEKMNSLLQNPATMKLLSDPSFMKGAVDNFMKSTTSNDTSSSTPPSITPSSSTTIDSKTPNMFDKISNMFKSK